MRYERIISLGFFCGVAQELERYGFRDCSLPFDWVISNFKSINQLIDNRFEDLFGANNLSRDHNYPYIVKHKGYKFDFYHDFKIETPIQDQLTIVGKKYARRINRFYQLLYSDEPILFIKYMDDSDTATDIDQFINLIKVSHSNSCYSIKGFVAIV